MGKDEKDLPEEGKGTPEEEIDTSKDKKVKMSRKEFDKMNEELEKAKSDAEHWKNEYYRAYADMNNLRKSLEEDHRKALRYRSQGFLENLLPALDNYYVAMNITPTSPEAKNYQQGFIYIYNQLEQALEAEGVKEVTPKLGDAFDMNYMHAVDTVIGEKENLVTKVYSKGYYLHDRLIRSAMVQVSVLKKEEEEKPESEKEKTDTGEEIRPEEPTKGEN